MSQKKQSLIMGALTSSAGIFVTKLLGIFYMIPFTALAGEGNLNFYSYAYGVYEILLNISLAGLPFAIATMIAKYYLREDYKAIMYVRRLANNVMIGFGIIAAGVMFIFALPIATYITPSGISPEDLIVTKNMIMVISLAFFTVPLLSSFRGFFQGLKDLKTYAFSQVLEQFTRIAFILTFGFIMVSILSQDGIWAIYGAVAGAFISSLVAILHLYLFKSGKVRRIKRLADTQQVETADRHQLAKELFDFAIPYLLVTFLGNSLNIVNTTFFANAMDLAGASADTTRLLYSMIMLTTSKLASIPQFLATGFAIAIVPYVTTCYENNDIRMIKRYILDAIDSVLYLGIPLCFFLFAIGTQIYYVMYGSATSYELGGEVLRWVAVTALFGTISPVINGLMMAVRLRKKNIIIMGIGFLVKLGLFFPLIYVTGYRGAILSSALCSITIIILDLIMINRQYHIDFKPTFFKLIYMMLGLLAMWGSFLLLQWLGLGVTDQSRLIALIELAVYGFAGMAAYIGVTSFLHLPQTIFHMNDNNVIRFLKQRFITNRE